jgi:hypothetical protein
MTSSFRDGAEPPRDGDNYSMTQSVVPAVGDRWIYHFTHVDNLEAIRAAGCLRCDAIARAGMTRTEVGAPDIKESRRWRTIPVEPGGRVGDYVPFYFAPRSPMMYRIACDRRDSIPNRYAGGDKPLVYLVTSVGAVVAGGSTWVSKASRLPTASSYSLQCTSRQGTVPRPPTREHSPIESRPGVFGKPACSLASTSL